MTDLTHLWKIGQSVKVLFEGKVYKGKIKETFKDHI